MIDVETGVISPSRMCNEPCCAPVTFVLIDYKQRQFNMQRRAARREQDSIDTNDDMHIARGQNPPQSLGLRGVGG